MNYDRRPGGRRTPKAGGRRDDLPLGYFDAREAAMAKAEYDEIMSRVPYNFEAEAALLGAMMIDNKIIEKVTQRLRPEHFYEPVHARIFDRIIMLAGQGKVANPVTVRPFFEGEVMAYSDDGGNTIEQPLVSYLAKLTGSGAALIGVHHFANQIIDLALLRDVIEVAKSIGDAASNTAEEINPSAIITMAESRLNEISESVPARAKTGSGWDDAFDETIADAQDIADGKPVAGITIAEFPDWNTVVGRMEPEDYIMLAGRPSMGKTAVACAVAAGSAMAGHGTDFLSLEMARKLISRRITANMIFEEGVTSNYSEQAEGRFTKEDYRAIAEQRERIRGKPLFIDSPDSMYIEDLLPWLRMRRRAWAARGIEQKLVVIDYLERFGVRQRYTGETERLTILSRTLKSALKSAGVAGVVLAQLSRAVEQREDKHPVLSDLRQSGSLEQDADTVAFVYRDQYYLERAKPSESDAVKFNAWQDDYIASRDRLELYSAKRREGALTKRTGYFFTDYQAVRSSDFYRTQTFGGGGFDFGENSSFGGG